VQKTPRPSVTCDLQHKALNTKHPILGDKIKHIPDIQTYPNLT